MKKRADEVDVYAKSKLLPEKADEGVIPWVDLSQEQRVSFAASFLSAEAIDARMRLLKPLRQDSHDTVLAGAIRLYRASVQHEMPDEPIHEAMLKDMIFAFFATGDWEKLEWLIGYGKTRYPHGFMGEDTTIQEMEPLGEKHETSKTLNSFMLREFSRLSGISMTSLVVPITFANDPSVLPSSAFNLVEVLALNLAGFPPSPAVVLPKGLPTKGYLDSETMKKWVEYNGDKSMESAETSLSRERGRLGLDKLPKMPPRR